MSDSPYIFDVTADNFAQIVLQGSAERLVLVDFWADWCAPCRSLMPVLAKLAEEYRGQFILAKINSDQQQALGTQYNVRSLPTVKFFLHGKVVNEFMGAQPESQIRRLLEQHIVRESDRLVSQALNLLQQGAQEDAQKLLEQANNIEPGRANIVAALAAILLGKNELQRASELIQTLSHEDRHSAEIAGLAAQIEFLLEAVNLPDTDTLSANIESNPDDLESRHQLATVLAAQEKFEAAMQQWLEVMRRDRGFREDIGRKSLLKLFDRLGDDPLAAAYRRKMFNLLY